MKQGWPIIQHFFIAFLSVGSVLLSGLLAVIMATPFKHLGGLPRHGTWAWLFLFVLLSSACLLLIQRKLSRSSGLPYWVGIMAGVYCAPLYFCALFW